jgi:hypothetical protein
MLRTKAGVSSEAGAGVGSKAASGATNYTLDANIISWWMMEDAATPTLDGSANNNDLTWAGDTVPARSATHIQGSYSLDFEASTYSYESITDAGLAPTTFPGKSVTGGTGTFSIGAWVRLESNTGDMGIISKFDPGNDMSYCLDYVAATTAFRFRVSSNGWAYDGTVEGTTTNPANATWYHVVGTYDGAHLHIWVGTSAGASAEDATEVDYTGGIFRSAVAFAIGANKYNGTGPFDGLIDEAFIFSDALTGVEIESIRAHGLAGER